MEKEQQEDISHGAIAGGHLVASITVCDRCIVECIASQPKENVWVTLANQTGQDSICLSISSPGNPFSTCLVRLPLDNWDLGLPNPFEEAWGGWQNATNNWDGCLPHLNHLPIDPQELELLGSTKMNWCLYFNYSGANVSREWSVNATLEICKNESLRCNQTSSNISKSSNAPIGLPRGVFLICGDRAWPGIPSHIKGGPCSLGRLTLLTPTTSMILSHRRGAPKTHSKRGAHAYNSQCEDAVNLWNLDTIAAVAILALGTAVAKGLSTLNKLGCWLAKQSNATSEALMGLLMDVDSIRHATLQNRAAIDFLLLAQGHGCKELEGMCCVNLSDHLESIHRSIQQLKEGVQKLRMEDPWN